MKNYFRGLGGVLLFGFFIIGFLHAAEEAAALAADDSEVEDQCAICLRSLSFEPEDDFFRGPVELSCKHKFHWDCIGRWFYVSCGRLCPLCRATERLDVEAYSEIVIAATRDDIAGLRGMIPEGLSEYRIMELLERRDGRGYTALHVAAERNNAVLVTYLLGLLSRMNRVKFILMKDNYEQSALHKAAALGHVEIANLLLFAIDCSVEQRKLIEQKDFAGRTPLFMAMWKKHDEAVWVLRKYLPKKGSLRELRRHSSPCLYALLADDDE